MIDLRSDTLTKPTPTMLTAMLNAPLGDDVYGEDPTVNRLEAIAAETLGKEAAIFATSGTQSNLLGLLTHCQRGEEYIVGQQAHTYRLEGGGAAVLGSIQPQPLDFEADGSLNLEKVSRAIKPDDYHFAHTRLLCLENTQGGKVLPLPYLAEAAHLARDNGLKLHLDGARVFNAAVKQTVSVREIAHHFDTVSVCLSKGLGAPVGSVLCGSRDEIKVARRWRKMLGGGMRQAGILAAAGIIALTEHVERLADDHANAARLAAGLAQIEEIEVDPTAVQTNILFVTLAKATSLKLADYLKQQGIMISGGRTIRLVTHLDVTEADIETVIAAIKRFFSKKL